MTLIFSAKHKICEKGNFHAANFEYGDAEEFISFYHWDDFIDDEIIKCARGHIGVDKEFARNGKKYLLQVMYDGSIEWNLSYKIFLIN